MIFVTVGTTKYPFNRLFQALDSVLIQLAATENLIVQTGPTPYHFKYPRTQQFTDLPFGQIIRYFQQSHLSIVHGGASTVFQALNYCPHLPLVVPRHPRFREHLNDHQIIFVKQLSRKYHFSVNLIPKNLSIQIKRILTHPTPNPHRRQLRCSPRLIINLNRFITNQFFH